MTPGLVARIVATVLAFVAAVALVIGTIGPPLVGNGVFLTSDLIYFAFPWQAHGEPVNELHAQLGGPTTDTVDVVYPARAVFGSQARDQHFLSWNPWNFGGEPLGATSNMGQLNPLAWPFLFLPGWFAPAMVKLAGMASALGFTYLFCRRLGTDRVPAVLGAVVYAGSGFIIMWNNWPQADVASLIPALFWATERFLQKRTASSAVPIALALAALLLAMFPAVVGYTVTVLAGYVAFRLGAALWTARRHPAYASEAVDRPAAAPAPVVVEPAVVARPPGSRSRRPGRRMRCQRWRGRRVRWTPPLGPCRWRPPIRAASAGSRRWSPASAPVRRWPPAPCSSPSCCCRSAPACRRAPSTASRRPTPTWAPPPWSPRRRRVCSACRPTGSTTTARPATRSSRSPTSAWSACCWRWGRWPSPGSGGRRPAPRWGWPSPPCSWASPPTGAARCSSSSSGSPSTTRTSSAGRGRSWA